MLVLARICADMRGCFRGFFFGSIVSCRACLARDAAHRHIVATNSAGPDEPCVKCCHFNGLQTYAGSIRRLSGCDPGAIAVIPAKSLSSPVLESRLRDCRCEDSHPDRRILGVAGRRISVGSGVSPATLRGQSLRFRRKVSHLQLRGPGCEIRAPGSRRVRP